jgi:hypothetical protein
MALVSVLTETPIVCGGSADVSGWDFTHHRRSLE